MTRPPRRERGETRRALLRAAGVGGTALAVGGTGRAAGQATADLTQTARLEPPEKDAGEFGLFGLSVDLDTTGERDRLLVGAPLVDVAAEDGGAAYLFEDDGGEWAFRYRFDVGGAAGSGDRFGNAVALSGDTALVGAPGDSEVGREAGAVYVFDRSGEAWSRTQKLLPTSYDENWDLKPTFGSRVAMAGDRAAVAVPGNSDFDTGNGLVSVFERTSDGTWEGVDTLYPQESAAQYPYFLVEFGYDISVDGDRILVGAPGDGEAGSNAGAAYVFEPGADGYTPTRKFTPDPPRQGARFGYSVSLSGDRALVGAPFHERTPGEATFGLASVFALEGGEWTREAALSVEEGAEPGGWFGYHVSLGGDRLLVGRPNASGEEQSDTGAAYVFDRSDTDWVRSARLAPEDPENAELFGFTTALAEGSSRAVVTDSWYRGPAPQSGAAYVFGSDEGTGVGGPGFGVLGTLAAGGLLGLGLRAFARTGSAAESGVEE